MGKRFKVTPEELEKTSKNLAQISDKYDEICKQLFQEVSNTGAAWTGDDNLAFVEQIQGLTRELKDMAEKIRYSSEILLRQKQNYTNFKDTNIAQVKKLRN